MLIPNHVSYLDPVATRRGAQLESTAGNLSGRMEWNFFRRMSSCVSLSWLGKILPVEPTRAARPGLRPRHDELSKTKRIWFGSPKVDFRLLGNSGHRWGPGIGMLLERFPRDAIPVFVSGSYEAWPTGQSFPRFRPIHLLELASPARAQELMREGRGEKPHQKITNALQGKGCRAQIHVDSPDQPTATRALGCLMTQIAGMRLNVHYASAVPGLSFSLATCQNEVRPSITPE